MADAFEDSNLRSFLKAAGAAEAADSKSVEVIGSALGTAADLAGAAGFVISVVSWVTSLMGDDSPSELQIAFDALSAEIQAEFDALYDRVYATDLEVMGVAISGLLAVPLGYLATLTDDPSADLGLPDSVIAACLGPLETIGEEEPYWKIDPGAVHRFRPRWPWRYAGIDFAASPFPFDLSNLHGGGALQSAFVDLERGLLWQDERQNSFNYRYALAGVLYAMYLALFVGRSVRADFVTRHASSLRRAVSVLKTKHDRIRDGIQIVRPPGLDDLIPVVSQFGGDGGLLSSERAPFIVRWDPKLGYVGSSFWDAPTTSPNETVAPADNAVVEPSVFSRPYGAVQIDSGYAGDLDAGTNTVRSYPDLFDDLPDPSPERFFIPFPLAHDAEGAFSTEAILHYGWYERFYALYLIRTLSLYKRVYADIGLPQVVSAMNAWCAMLGDYGPVGGAPVVDASELSLGEALRLLNWRRVQVYDTTTWETYEAAFTAPTLRQLGGYVAYLRGESAPRTSLRAMLDGS